MTKDTNKIDKKQSEIQNVIMNECINQSDKLHKSNKESSRKNDDSWSDSVEVIDEDVSRNKDDAKNMYGGWKKEPVITKKPTRRKDEKEVRRKDEKEVRRKDEIEEVSGIRYVVKDFIQGKIALGELHQMNSHVDLISEFVLEEMKEIELILNKGKDVKKLVSRLKAFCKAAKFCLKENGKEGLIQEKLVLQLFSLRRQFLLLLPLKKHGSVQRFFSDFSFYFMQNSQKYVAIVDKITEQYCEALNSSLLPFDWITEVKMFLKGSIIENLSDEQAFLWIECIQEYLCRHHCEIILRSLAILAKDLICSSKCKVVVRRWFEKNGRRNLSEKKFRNFFGILLFVVKQDDSPVHLFSSIIHWCSTEIDSLCTFGWFGRFLITLLQHPHPLKGDNLSNLISNFSDILRNVNDIHVQKSLLQWIGDILHESALSTNPIDSLIIERKSIPTLKDLVDHPSEDIQRNLHFCFINLPTTFDVELLTYLSRSPKNWNLQVVQRIKSLSEKILTSHLWVSVMDNNFQSPVQELNFQSQQFVQLFDYFSGQRESASDLIICYGSKDSLIVNAVAYLIHRKLYTRFGNPLKTFEKIESLGISLKDGRKNLDKIDLFCCFCMFLENQGTTILENLVKVPYHQEVLNYFKSNEKVLRNWFIRLRPLVLNLSFSTGLYDYCILYAWNILHETNKRDIPDGILTILGMSLCETGNEFALKGLHAWLKHACKCDTVPESVENWTKSSLLLSISESFLLESQEHYEQALKKYQTILFKCSAIKECDQLTIDCLLKRLSYCMQFIPQTTRLTFEINKLFDECKQTFENLEISESTQSQMNFLKQLTQYENLEVQSPEKDYVQLLLNLDSSDYDPILFQVTSLHQIIPEAILLFQENLMCYPNSDIPGVDVCLPESQIYFISRTGRIIENLLRSNQISYNRYQQIFRSFGRISAKKKQWELANYFIDRIQPTFRMFEKAYLEFYQAGQDTKRLGDNLTFLNTDGLPDFKIQTITSLYKIQGIKVKDSHFKDCFHDVDSVTPKWMFKLHKTYAHWNEKVNERIFKDLSKRIELTESEFEALSEYTESPEETIRSAIELFVEEFQYVSERNILSKVFSNASDGLFSLWKNIKSNLLGNYHMKAVQNYLRSLKFVSSGSADALRVTLHLLKFFIQFEGEIYDQCKNEINQASIENWYSVIPQLIGMLNLRNTIAEEILMNIGKHNINLLAYRLKKKSKFSQSENLTRKLKNFSEKNQTILESVEIFLREVQKLSFLPEERFIEQIGGLQVTLKKQYLSFKEEAQKLMMKDAIEDKHIIRGKFQHYMGGSIVTLESLLHSIQDSESITEHEIKFKQYESVFEELIHDMKVDPEKFNLDEVVEKLSRLQKSFKSTSHGSMNIADITPLLLSCRISDELRIPIPDNTLLLADVYINGIAPTLVILPSKTKPKRISLLGNDGQSYNFLLKSKEDLHLDERVMQLLSFINQFLTFEKVLISSKLRANTYSVIPFGPQSGILRWVDGVYPMLSSYREYFSGKQKPFSLVDWYYSKLVPKLKGDVSLPYPKAILKEVLLEMEKEVPHQLISHKFYATSRNHGMWWQKIKRFNSSTAVMSMIGHVIGLGDRHLDNILVDYDTGDLVHIDYNVCFDKGKRLKIPEVVPFRLTPSIVKALGVHWGLKGMFKEFSVLTLNQLCKERDHLMSLLEAFIYDPVIDWTDTYSKDDDMLKRNILVHSSMIQTRISEILSFHKDSIHILSKELERLETIVGQLDGLLPKNDLYRERISEYSIIQERLHSIPSRIPTMHTNAQREDRILQDLQVMKLCVKNLLTSDYHKMIQDISSFDFIAEAMVHDENIRKYLEENENMNLLLDYNHENIRKFFGSTAIEISEAIQQTKSFLLRFSHILQDYQYSSHYLKRLTFSNHVRKIHYIVSSEENDDQFQEIRESEVLLLLQQFRQTDNLIRDEMTIDEVQIQNNFDLEKEITTLKSKFFEDKVQGCVTIFRGISSFMVKPTNMHIHIFTALIEMLCKEDIPNIYLEPLHYSLMQFLQLQNRLYSVVLMYLVPLIHDCVMEKQYNQKEHFLECCKEVIEMNIACTFLSTESDIQIFLEAKDTLLGEIDSVKSGTDRFQYYKQCENAVHVFWETILEEVTFPSLKTIIDQLKMKVEMQPKKTQLFHEKYFSKLVQYLELKYSIAWKIERHTLWSNFYRVITERLKDIWFVNNSSAIFKQAKKLCTKDQFKILSHLPCKSTFLKDLKATAQKLRRCQKDFHRIVNNSLPSDKRQLSKSKDEEIQQLIKDRWNYASTVSKECLNLIWILWIIQKVESHSKSAIFDLEESIEEESSKTNELVQKLFSNISSLESQYQIDQSRLPVLQQEIDDFEEIVDASKIQKFAKELHEGIEHVNAQHLPQYQSLIDEILAILTKFKKKVGSVEFSIRNDVERMIHWINQHRSNLIENLQNLHKASSQGYKQILSLPQKFQQSSKVDDFKYEMEKLQQSLIQISSGNIEEIRLHKSHNVQEGNTYAKKVIHRVNNRLTLNPDEVPKRVDKLIERAMSLDNRSQMYAGWAAFL